MQLLKLQHTRPGCVMYQDFNQKLLFYINHDVDFSQKHILSSMYLRLQLYDNVDFNKKISLTKCGSKSQFFLALSDVDFNQKRFSQLIDVDDEDLANFCFGNLECIEL